jgi:5,10-methylene-tetrahydrofolate dehydrogenase/Methenyl tetrahydrofolate cyclohydrolase
LEELRGKEIVEAMKAECLDFLKEKGGVLPALAVLRVGEKEADVSYERSIKKRFQSFGLEVKDYHLEENCSNAEFQEVFRFLNEDAEIHGILVFRPLPPQINEEEMLEAMKKEKDVDGISRSNLAGLLLQDPRAFAPCTAEAVMELCRFYKVPLSGKEVCILGRSLVVGKPLSLLMLGEDATVTICHSRTENSKEICRRADVLVTAMGKAKAVGSSYCKEGATVIDVGINTDKDGNLCGDVDYDTMKTVAERLSPVPGGIGPITTAVLARHLVRAYQMQTE